MENNVGKLDARIRLGLAALLLAAAVIWNHIPVVALVTAFGALILAGTALTRVCPIYRACGISTCRVKASRRDGS